MAFAVPGPTVRGARATKPATPKLPAGTARDGLPHPQRIGTSDLSPVKRLGGNWSSHSL